MTTIDLGCDLGESRASIADGTDEALMAQISSVHIACGGHAGDDETMEASIRSALRHGVAIGAHPGYPDPEAFGRVELALSNDELAAVVEGQVRRLIAIAQRLGAAVRHVKPHGALYHAVTPGGATAVAFAHGVSRIDPRMALYAFAGSGAIGAWESLGFRVVPEGFADRRYEANGSLRARHHGDALLTDPLEAAEQALRIARGVTTGSLRVHGDTPGAPSIARAVRARLAADGIRVHAP
jgi:5-oxoprolinase (ATP-hydrolysing) subunit A